MTPPAPSAAAPTTSTPESVKDAQEIAPLENRDLTPGARGAHEVDERRPTPARRFRAALALQRAGDLDSAARGYRALIADGELVAASHNNLGLIHQQRGELEEAVRQFQRAVESDPQYALPNNNLGVTLLAQGRGQAAAERFRRAAELDPRDPDALVNLALAEKSTGRPEQAKESLLHALTLAPDSAPAHYNLAVLYDHSGEAARAVEHYRAFLDHAGAEHASRTADVRARLEALERFR